MTMERDEKDRDKERDRDRGREKDRDRVWEKEKAKSKEKDRDLEKKRDRAKELEKEKDYERGKELEREKERVKDQERERRKEREKVTTKDKKKEKERSKKDRDKEKDKEKEREPEKERDKVAEREKERIGDREEREKERDREKDRDRQRLRLKEKERDREKERDHDRNRDKDWEKRDRELEKEREHEFEKGEKEKKRDDKDNFSREPQRPHSSASNLEERISKMREERQRANAEQRSSAKANDADDDINAWVNKSRNLEQRKSVDDKQKAARMAKILAEQDNEEDDDHSSDEFQSTHYGGKDLAGLRVRHGIDKVMEGHAVVLTLKDVSVLDGDDVNEEVDELENIEMSQQQAREDAYKAAKKRPGAYEDKFNNDMDALVTRTILPQYDDVAKEEGMILDATGGLSEESRKKLHEARERLEGASAKESLTGIPTKFASDFYTEEDMLLFKKPKKKKKLRKREKLDIDELEAEAVAAGLGAGDLGPRDSESRRAQKLAAEKVEADVRKNAYQNAFNKAEDASKVLREDHTVTPMEVDNPEASVLGGEEDEDLYRSLERARQAALKKQKDSGSAGAGPQSVVARLAALRQEPLTSSQRPTGTEAQDGNLVFTDTGEFCRSLQLDDAIIRRAGAKDAFGEEDEEAPVVENESDDTSKVVGGWTEVVEVDKKHPVGEEETAGEVAGEEPITEVSVGKGLAGALNLLKERGTLKETVDWGGRNMDKKRSKLVGIVDESNNKVGQRDILLDRLDEFGRTMTPKEAFRKLSHKFHGKGPGKMKQEKKMKQFQEELRLKQMNSGDTPLMAMEKVRDAQARMHTPYIVISGHIKPGQTSDPRSGFATVEKEPIGSLTPMLGDKGVGSLTPMLGDKKVEHFLGIKRKAESGSMGPPPPKQPRLER